MAKKRYWNYRVVTRKQAGEQEFLIAEVHYVNGKPEMYSERKDILSAMTLKDLKWIHKKVKRAFARPILNLDDWPKKFT